MHDHEITPTNGSAFLAWRGLERWWNKCGLIDDHFQQQIAERAKRWRKSFKRITATVNILAQ